MTTFRPELTPTSSELRAYQVANLEIQSVLSSTEAPVRDDS